MGKYNVMIVDDSSIIRGLLKRKLEEDGDIQVIDTAANGLIAVQTLKEKTNLIDVVILDIEMPQMDGITALKEMLKIKPTLKIIMSSTLTSPSAKITIQALALGASDYIEKPSSTKITVDNFYAHLIEKIKMIGCKNNAKVAPVYNNIIIASSSNKYSLKPANRNFRFSAMAIASSTGGPQALLSFFKQLDASKFNKPIFITQHMPATFTAHLARHITDNSNFTCMEAVENGEVQNKTIYLAPGNYHMTIHKRMVDNKVCTRLNQGPQENFCRPSAEPMLRSLNEVYSGQLLVVVLTGMGQDGSKASEQIANNGGIVIAQDKETSVVWSMPSAVINSNICSFVGDVTALTNYINKLNTER